jgi:hypothetical protein
MGLVARGGPRRSEEAVRLFAGLLAVIGGIAVVAAMILLGLWFAPLDGGKVIRLTPSPNGKFKAVWISKAGGGGLSPFCSSKISVAPTSVSEENLLQDRSYVVFSADCYSFGDHDKAKINWLSDTKLQIEFLTRPNLDSVNLKTTDASRTLQVSFVIH